MTITQQFQFKDEPLIVKLPTPKQLIQIEEAKILLSGGVDKYNAMFSMYRNDTTWMLTINAIDAEAFLSVTQPDLIKKHVKGEGYSSILDMPTNESYPFISLYSSIITWVNTQLSEIANANNKFGDTEKK